MCFAQGLVAQSGTIIGTVTNAIPHEPIAGVTIRVFGSHGADEISTDAMGVFRVKGIEDCCRILFDKEGFEAVGPSNLRFKPATDPAQLNLTMLPWPILQGRVLDPERHPIPGSTIEAVNLSWGQKTVTADSDGGFTLNMISVPESTF